MIIIRKLKNFKINSFNQIPNGNYYFAGREYLRNAYNQNLNRPSAKISNDLFCFFEKHNKHVKVAAGWRMYYMFNSEY